MVIRATSAHDKCRDSSGVENKRAVLFRRRSNVNHKIRRDHGGITIDGGGSGRSISSLPPPSAHHQPPRGEGGLADIVNGTGFPPAITP